MSSKGIKMIAVWCSSNAGSIRSLHLICLAFAGLLAGPARAQVNVPEGFEIVTFDRSPSLKVIPRINNCGQIVYQDRNGDWDIMMYDNGRTVNVTDNDNWEGHAEINDLGDLIFTRGEGRNEPTTLYLRIDGQEILFDENPGGFLGYVSNNAGHIAWSRGISRSCPGASSISYLWDGQRTIQISPTELYDQGEAINEFDQVSYMHTDFCADPWVGDIRLYSNGETIILPTQETRPVGTTINDRGQVVWNTARGLEIWNGRRTSLLVEGNLASARINNRGDVYFARWDDGRSFWQPWLSIPSHNGRELHRLFEGDGHHGDGDVNDWGEVTWVSWDQMPANETQMWLMRRIRTADSEFDDDVDLADAGALANCMTGPGRVDRLCDCRFLDLDHDGDVDLGDFARFQNAFRAP
ncbi:MAG: hypothetical protein C4547_10240 [Phycisphaerales bacterium]|nr:MAG: hypothetical protein C4547_10240 [Phycisphaerales bacterium]